MNAIWGAQESHCRLTVDELQNEKVLLILKVKVKADFLCRNKHFKENENKSKNHSRSH